MNFYTLAIDNAGPYALRKVKRPCLRIEVRENYNSANPPTMDLNQFAGDDSTGTNGGRVPKGTSAIYTRATVFTPTDPNPPGYINADSGSGTVLVIEHNAV
jgi:hypothetical protein